MKKFAIVFCLSIFVVQLIQIIYFERSNFQTTYDAEYWKDRYEHSQYQLPLSKRIIGDDGLFAYSGYRLINGDNPFSINNDKPPVAKYLFGLSILLFHNPLYVVLFFGFLALIVFYFIAKHFFKNSSLALFAATLLFLDPLFFSQFWITGLDLMQLFFLLLNILLLINIKKVYDRNIFIILGSGLSLGLFTEVKPPILLPIIFILETAYLFYKGFKKEYLLFVLSFSLGTVLPYIRFIFLGNSIIDILKVHKFMASIYLQSQLKAHTGAIWSALTVGKFPDVVTGAPINVSEWWMVWPVITFLGLTEAIIVIVAKHVPILNKGLSMLLLMSLFIFTFIPAYPRYLIIVLPFLYLFSIKVIDNYANLFMKKLLYIGILIYGIVNATMFLLPFPNLVLKDFYYNFEHQYFHDIYQQDIYKDKNLLISRSDFRLISQEALQDAEVMAIDVKELSKTLNKNNGKVIIKVIYKTQNLGEFSQIKDLNLKMENGKWKIKWNWNLIFDGFSPNYTVQTERILGRRGSLTDSGGKILAKDSEGYLVLVNPEQIDLKKEPKMLDFIGFIGSVKPPHLQNAYLENSLPETYVPLVTLFYPLDSKTKTKLLSFSGVKIVPYPSRIVSGINPLSLQNSLYTECCTRIYSKNYHGIEGLEKKYDSLISGSDGGSIVIKDDKGSIVRTILRRETKIGQDVVVTL